MAEFSIAISCTEVHRKKAEHTIQYMMTSNTPTMRNEELSKPHKPNKINALGEIYPCPEFAILNCFPLFRHHLEEDQKIEKELLALGR